MKKTHIGLVIELTTPESYLKIKVIDLKDDKYITKPLKMSGEKMIVVSSLYESDPTKSGYGNLSLLGEQIQEMLDSKCYYYNMKDILSIKINPLEEKINKLLKI